MLRRLLFLLLGLVGLLLLSYFLQPVKKGSGYDTATAYEQVTHWPRLPTGLQLGNPAGIGIDTAQNIVVFHRGERAWPLLGTMPDEAIQGKTILIISSDSGRLISSWGENRFIMPHGLTVDQENNIWVTDVGLHQVFKFTHEGVLLMKLGEAGVAGNDSLHFNQPTDVAVAKDGSAYVSDGYGNSRIVKFSAAGQYLFEWGKKGDEPGAFHIPHGLSLDSSGNVYVADRENNRIQVFDAGGHFLKQLSDASYGRICALTCSGAALYAVDDFSFLSLKHRGSDAFVFDTAGAVQTRFGRSGHYDGSTTWYHDLTVDREGNLYLADILGNRLQKFRRVQKL